MIRFMAAIAVALLAVALAIPAEARNSREAIIGGRPAGCPHAYCGCALAKYLNINDPRLNLAANWPRYYKGSRMIAVWRHHVALVEEMISPGRALLRDYNSGRGLSRLHVRDLRGAMIINRTHFASR